MKDKKIHLKEFRSPENFFSFLHEIGHALDFRREDIGDLKEYGRRTPVPEEEEVDEDKAWTKATEHKASQERNAWAAALKIARKIGLEPEIVKCIEKYAENKLDSYQETTDVRRVDVGFTGERRRKIRKRQNSGQ